MAVAIPTLVVTRDGGVLPSGASGTDVYIADNDGNVVVLATNPTGSPVTITLAPSVTVGAGMSVTGPTVTIPAGEYRWLGPLPPAFFNDAVAEAHITDPSGALVFAALRF